MNATTESEEFTAWRPGIESHVPHELAHLATIFRPQNVVTSLDAARELHGLTGFALPELVAFRPQRLALHELLIRITADMEVPDGSRIEDLGINFRDMARRFLARDVEPHMDLCIAAHADAHSKVRAAAQAVLAAAVPGLSPSAAPGVVPAPSHARFGLLRRVTVTRRQRPTMREERGWGPAEVAQLERMASSHADPLHVLVCRTLGRVLSGLFATHGYAWGTPELVLSVATTLAGNECASDAIGRVIEPMLRAGAARDGDRLLPRQDQPVVINTKGASAAGKSTLRPLHKKIAGVIGVDWGDFALISPDIWRKQLLDYGSLGSAYKYAGAFTGEEVQIIDQKLDRYMAGKHRRGEMSHLLIDRFRFDSFAPASAEAGSNLLTRFGQTVYLFFVVTPPDMLVERAWRRGLAVGRYKAVDDTLGHAIEAYGGMPDVLFTWVKRTDKRVRFEFLDNTVPLGDPPRTAAFGDNATCNVLDVGNLLNIERFARINVNAKSPESLYPDPAVLSSERNTGFLRRCISSFGRVNFADRSTGRVYLCLETGVPVWKDAAALASAENDADTRAGIRAVASEVLLGAASTSAAARQLPAAGEGNPTLGAWWGSYDPGDAVASRKSP